MEKKRKDATNEPKKLSSNRCSNPLRRDGHIGKSLRNISESISKMFPNLSLNAKICSQCRKMCNETKARDSSFCEDTEDSDFNDNDHSPSKKICLSREQQLEDLLEGLKHKFKNLPENDPLRVSILTIAPECWSIRQIAEEFQASYRMVKQAKDLRKSSGVLAIPPLKKGRNLPDETVSKVIEFYENDENSRIMPHKKETVTVRINDRKEKKQKRLLLSDIKVLHTCFKKKYPLFPIGLTKFAELRPKWCVLAGTSGTHNVCVCVIHQNVKAMIDAAGLETFSKNLKTILNNSDDCIRFILCDKPKDTCHVLQCKDCPKLENFSDLLLGILNQNNIRQVIFSKWQSTDRCTLRQECLPTEDFVEELCEKLKELISHDFISKAQSKFISNKKENLQEDEVLLQCDFAENYAYVLQDAAQGFHYNNDQCTVFTVLFYYRFGGQLEHQSIILLSDSTTHDAAAVYIMQQNVIPIIRQICPKFKKIIYATDGAKQHFKNRYQMSNLMNHKDDFDAEAEWHFHATAHGKGPCDGLGASLKREATRYSLQVHQNNAILNSTRLFTWAKGKFENIKFFYYSKEHQKTKKFLNKRFSTAPAVTNIQMSHAFIPTSNKVLKVKRYSAAKDIISTVQY